MAASPPCCCTRSMRKKPASSAGPEAAGVDGLEAIPCARGTSFLDEGWAVLDADGFPCLRMRWWCPASGPPFHNPLHLIEHVVVEGRRRATGLPHQAGMAWDDVASTAAVELPHVDAGHAVPMAGVPSMAVVAHAGRRQGIVARVGLEPAWAACP